ncbi:response regulator [Belnapia sp. T6]|uniref:Response regulator n=2 Tax=Belnapia mucosa TaxID=2804532 RepID=A0ABS1VCN0_9PROT|nr:response regulator [Belnapia mucosa]
MPGDAGHESSRRVVHVIDDDDAVRRAIALLLRSARIPTETHVSGMGFLEALAKGGDDQIGCVLVDVRMPGLNGVELLHRLQEQGFRRPVIVMTAHGDVPTAIRAMKAGAADFLEKPFSRTVLLTAIRTALETPGAAEAAPPRLPADTAAAAEAGARIAALPPRERQVLDLLLAGKSNKAIAQELDLSPRTVETHRARLMTRLGVASLAEAVRFAILAELGGYSEKDRDA